MKKQNLAKRTMSLGAMLLVFGILAFGAVGCSKSTSNEAATTDGTTTTDATDTTAVTSTDATSGLELSLDDLAKYDGKNGNKAYVAINGTIYDVTDNREWKNGEHDKGKYQAGTDLSDVIGNAPHGDSVLKDLPVVGKLIQ